MTIKHQLNACQHKWFYRVLPYIKITDMKKIAAVLDGLRFSDSTLEYTLWVARHSSSHIVGVFADDFLYNSFSAYRLITAGATQHQIDELSEQDEILRNVSVEKFRNACKDAHVEYSVHRDRDIAIQEVRHESIFADLLVIDAKETFQHRQQELPTRFVRELLAEVQCPVLLAPEEFHEIERVILLYDGEPSSVHAIKMFSYLMPWLNTAPIELISVNHPEEGLKLDDGKLMREFMKRHFPSVQYHILNGHEYNRIPKVMEQQKPGTLVVLGAYSRGAISRWFRESLADTLMSAVKLPLFIAHHR
ncbi:universal stress protein [Chitinophaga sedimenti]|uniref:universal stress protein n=1 Tax=Chitinophaga sedimenti TaxID=2033606 RepID=UPI002003FFEA|nr:universal stress protein [Chitinophaga sedimenti]MCK7557155.1 universal stress protein [Chitinophaga sedimenti]